MKYHRRQFLSALGSSAAIALLAQRARGLAIGAAVTTAEIAADADRPEYHFLAPHNWMNDPNGPVWWKGKYHLFYQMNPNAAIWGDMHWGHAVSTDMVHWKHDGIALAPTPGGPDSEGCFSGSAVVRDGIPTFIYTGVKNSAPDQATIRDGSDKLRETQLLATAEDDDLRQWKKLPAPIIATPPKGMQVTGFRDPCPWRETDGWYLAVGSGEHGKGGCVLLYRSQDLRTWEYLHPLLEGQPKSSTATNPVDTGDMWECPDFFEVNGKHCLFYSAEGKVQWSTGEYDTKEHRFHVTRSGVLDHGAYYAPKSFAAPDGRRILWGWITEKRPEAEFARAGWSGMMSLPRVLTIGQQGQLEMRPAAEVEKLRGTAERAIAKADAPLRQKMTTLRRELRARVEPASGPVTVRLLAGGKPAWELTIDAKGNTAQCGKTSFALQGLPWARPELRIYVDGSVVEAFIGAQEAITSRVYGLKPDTTEIEVSVSGDHSVAVELWPLDAISADRLTT